MTLLLLLLLFFALLTVAMPSYSIAADTLGDMAEMSSIMDCFGADGYIDTERYLAMMMDAASDDFDETAEELICEEEPDDDESDDEQPKKRQRRIILARRNADGELEAIPPTESLWWHIYVDCPQLNDKRWLNKFRRRFRIPYQSFLTFVEEAKANNWFPRWTGKGTDATGKKGSPVELLILGAFRYLGRGFTFDDLEESTAISEEVHRCFFHKFIEVGSTILYDKYVKTPTTAEEAREHMLEFELAGMPGTFGSTDATHIVHDMCNWKSRRAHLGGKSKHPTRTYNMTVNHRRRILSTTPGHPGSWNDKTLALFDSLMADIKSGDILEDNTFEVCVLVHHISFIVM